MRLTAKQVAQLFGKQARTITNWVNSDPPCPSILEGRERFFDSVAVLAWHDARTMAKARAEWEAEMGADVAYDLDRERARKTAAEALMAEIELAQKRGAVIPAEVHGKVVGELCDRLRAVCINVPSNYAIDLEREGVDPAAAEAVLRNVSDALTRALRGTADEDGTEGEGDDDHRH